MSRTSVRQTPRDSEGWRPTLQRKRIAKKFILKSALDARMWTKLGACFVEEPMLRVQGWLGTLDNGFLDKH